MIGLLLQLDAPAVTEPLVAHELGICCQNAPPQHKAQMDQQLCAARDGLYRSYAERLVINAFRRSKRYRELVTEVAARLPEIDAKLAALVPFGPGAEELGA